MNLTREEKRAFRSLLFKHQDGIAITASIAVLERHAVFDFLASEKSTSLSFLLEKFPQFHSGYLNVALRSLSSQGILNYEVTQEAVRIETTAKFIAFQRHITHYVYFEALFHHYYELFKSPFKFSSLRTDYLLAFAAYLANAKKALQTDAYFKVEIAVHLEGVLLAPMLVYLGYHGDLENIETVRFLKDESLQKVLRLLDLYDDNGLTKKGKFLFAKSYAYGVTTSYIPIMNHMETYLTGDFLPFFKQDHLGNEQHVFRGMNVWGSGGSHATYFNKFDAVLVDIFNKPLAEQPKGIIDVGCGNGALLEHIFDLIWNKTQRKDDLSNNKLILIGADYNKEALLSTKRNLEKANVWAEVVWGDIGNPAEIDRKLQELYNVKLGELLNVRSFLDHNRPFNVPKASYTGNLLSTGAFAHRGKQLHNSDVAQSLVEHFEKWKPYIQHHGLLFIELHTVSPDTVAMNLGRTPCTAYDVTHGFSDQYIVELDVFLEAISKAGITIDPTHSYCFPSDEIATISIHLVR
ncbi:class I SAM-dependent methyltransferase [Kordia algicida OT-1]|uniref:Polyketide synthase n=1 Tax=Kordia algicida OT-1 TaxID=391587 RepID=A9DTA2_9FLAO|nr:class I SAM-dependent methyltransferase [Kordia algicida]EDP97045.1 polyketide synthase [Kordia algicida OT-1]